jgi:putative tricarboxylic transport membrane protein
MNSMARPTATDDSAHSGVDDGRKAVNRERPMRRVSSAMTVVLAMVLSLAGCTRPATDLAELRIMVPNSPGSGYDVTARTVAKALEDAAIIRGVEVFNLPGGGGTVGLQRVVYERGNAQLLMLMGLGLVGAQFHGEATARLADTTPIARLIEEPEIVVVTIDSPYQSLADLVAAWRANPGAVTVGGGSSPGGPDHLAPMLIAKSIGVAPRSVKYVRYDGGGELLAAILGRHVAFGVSGIGEYADQIRSGQLRVLAVTSGTRVPGISAPTLREAGVDVVFTNWRGIVAPPDLRPRDVSALHEVVEQLHHSSPWRNALEKNGWTDAYLTGDEFAAFIRTENDRLGSVLTDLGLT